MIVIARTIPHKDQRYDTAGDYVDRDMGRLRELYISDMKNIDYEFLVLIHELIEQHLCLKRGILEPDIMKFDIESGLENPGESEKAPYHKEHMFSERIEKLVAEELGIDWNKYSDSFDKLEWSDKTNCSKSE